MNQIFKKKSNRSNVFLQNSFYNFIYVGIKLIIGLMLVPLILEFLGKERFGIWQTILSGITFISVLNFGYPNSLRNLITQKTINSSKKEIGGIIGITYLKIFKISVALFFIIIPIVYFFINPDFLFLKGTTPSKEIITSLLIFISFTLLNNTLGLSDSIAYGFQKSSLTSFFQVIYFSFCYLLIYFIGNKTDLNLIHMSIIFGGSLSFSYIISGLYQLKKLKIPINFKVNDDLKKETKKLSTPFFIAHLLSLMFLSIDNFIISSVLGAEETASYSIISKIFFTLIMVFSILLIHFWNSVTDAFEKKEFKWIFKTIKVLYIISIFVFFVGLIVSFFQEELINLWLGDNNLNLKSISFYLFSIYTLLHCINAIFVNLQNGIGNLRLQIITNIIILVVYAVACYIIDISYYGYNSILVIKIGVMIIAVILNSRILKKITNGNLS